MKYYFNKGLLLILFMLLSITAAIKAQSGIEPYEIQRNGQAGWQFLKINGDARQAAMGSAFTALANCDGNAVWGNPSALIGINDYNVTLNKTNWIADIGYQSLSVAKNFDGIGVFAFSVAAVDYGDIPETVNSLSDDETRTEAVVTGRNFTASDLAIGVTYARKIIDQLFIGGSFRWIRESIADVSMTNWSLDFGTTFYTGFRSLRLGVVARNFGPDSHFGGFNEKYQSEPEDIKMPIDFRFGLAMDFLDEPESKNLLTVSVDAVHPNDGTEKLDTGLDYTYNKMFSVRTGYKFNYDEESFTFGAGLNYKISDYTLGINYAYVDFGGLKQVHMFSININL